MHPKHPVRRGVEWASLVAVTIFLGVAVYNDPIMDAAKGIKPKAVDWCAKANLVACKVTQQGEWILVTTPDGAQHMIYVQGGKVVQVQ